MFENGLHISTFQDEEYVDSWFSGESLFSPQPEELLDVSEELNLFAGITLTRNRS